MENKKGEIFNREINKYFDKIDYDKDIIREGIVESVLKEKEINQENIKNIHVKNIISFISTAELEDFDFYAVEKTLKIFNEIKIIILFVTEQTKISAEKLKSKLQSDGKRVQIELTGLDDYEEIYESLAVIMDKYELDREETIIDSTQGPRMLGAVFYKFAVEQGIKLISWQSELNDGNRRIPGKDKFNFIKAPQLKNFKLYQNANKLISNYKFKEASMLYSQINNNEMAFVLLIFSDIFSYESLKNYDAWTKQIELNIKKLKEIKDKSIRKKISKYIWLFSQLVTPFRLQNLEMSELNKKAEKLFAKTSWDNLNYYNQVGTEDYLGIYSYSWFSEEDRKIIYKCIKMDYLISAFPNSLIHKIIDMKEYSELKFDKIEDILKIAEISELYLNTDVNTELNNMGALDYIFHQDFEKRIFNLKKDFTYNINIELSLQEGVLKIPHLKKEINLKEEFESLAKEKPTRELRPFKIIFERKEDNYFIEYKDLAEILNIKDIEELDRDLRSDGKNEEYEKAKKNNNVYKSRFKQYGNKLNSFIENKSGLKEFFIIDEFDDEFSLSINMDTISL